jgi:hypothetical protein
MRPELAKDDLGIDEPARLHVLVRIAQSPMQHGMVVVIEPVSRIGG